VIFILDLDFELVPGVVFEVVLGVVGTDGDGVDGSGGEENDGGIGGDVGIEREDDANGDCGFCLGCVLGSMIVFSSSPSSSSSRLSSTPPPLPSTSPDPPTKLKLSSPLPLLSKSLSYLPTPNFIPKVGTGLITPSSAIDTSANISVSFDPSIKMLSSTEERRRARLAWAGVVQNLSSEGLEPVRGVDGAGGGLGLGLGLGLDEDEEAVGGVDFAVDLDGIGGLTRGTLPVFCWFNAASFCRNRQERKYHDQRDSHPFPEILDLPLYLSDPFVFLTSQRFG
jgi:hypothetical protein